MINHPDGQNDNNTVDPDITINENTGNTTETSAIDYNITPVTAADNEKIAKKYLDALTTRDFEGVGMVIAALDNSLFTPENGEFPASESRVLRNRAVEKKYNTIIMTNIYPNIDVMRTEAKEAQKSGMFFAHLLAIPSVDLGSFKTEEMLFNINSLPFTDYTAPYFNRDAIKQMSGGYNVYGAAGELTEDMGYMYVVLFNKSVLDKYNAINPYISVKDGSWTWDKMREIIITVNDNVNSTEGFTFAGHASHTTIDTYTDIMFASAGLHYMTSGVGIIPYVSYNKTTTAALIETARRLLYEDCYFFEGADNSAMTEFYNGNLLFYVNRAITATWFINMKDSWGILPLPKLSDSQNDYYTYCDTSVPVMSVLNGSVGIEEIGLFLQAMNAASFKYINDTYYNYFANNVFRDNDSINMLDYVRKNLRYDFSYIFGSEYSYIPEGTYGLVRRAVKKGTALEPYYSDYSARIYKVMEKAFMMPE